MEKNYSKRFYLTLGVVFVLLFGLAFVSTRTFLMSNMLFGTNSTNSTVDADADNYYKYFKMFQEAYTALKTEFYQEDKVLAKDLIYGAISGMMDSVEDDYTMFMEPTFTEEFFITMNASFGGLGIHIGVRDDWLTVIAPIEDTPAWRAGLQPNDKIIQIDGESTEGWTTTEAVAVLRGEAGSDVTVTIYRDGVEEAFDVTITREIINLKTVKSEMIENDGQSIAYLRITDFGAPTFTEFESNLSLLLNQNPDGIIIDLRNNPGGYLDVVIECVDLFLEEGLIVYTRGRTSDNNEEDYATKAATIVSTDIPLLVMINEGSASASEIFSGAMQDTGRGVLLGTQSFGKGLVQKTYTFSDDGSMIKYTVAQYFTPAGNMIDQVGLTPDVEVDSWYSELEDDEINAFVEVSLSNYVGEWLNENPDYTEDDLSAYRRELGSMGYSMGLKTLKYMVHLEESLNEVPDLYDLEFDNQLVKALNVMQNYEDYKKELVYYEDAE